MLIPFEKVTVVALEYGLTWYAKELPVFETVMSDDDTTVSPPPPP
jgi:hypothetical protein